MIISRSSFCVLSCSGLGKVRLPTLHEGWWAGHQLAERRHLHSIRQRLEPSGTETHRKRSSRDFEAGVAVGCESGAWYDARALSTPLIVVFASVGVKVWFTYQVHDGVLNVKICH